MAIREKTIEQHGEKQVVVMAASDRFNEARAVFMERRYAKNEAYLVVCHANGQVGVASFLDLVEVLGMIGPNSLSLPLSALKIPPASRVVEEERFESGLEVVQWVAAHPNSTVVVVDKKGDFVCLLTNPNRARSLSSSLQRLHGKWISLLDDLRVDPAPREQTALISPPDCDHSLSYRYDIQQNQYFCRACGQKMSGL